MVIGCLDASPGVTLDIFHSLGTLLKLSETLKSVVNAGVIDVAVPRSMMLEIPSGPNAVLCIDRTLKTSSWVQAKLERVGLGGWGKLQEC